jgi:DNA-binding GntR family transcriptional regulator
MFPIFVEQFDFTTNLDMLISMASLPSDDVLRTLSFERSSTMSQVAEVLRDAILSGRLQPGAPLREPAIAGSLQVSRNTVREAFRILGQEGLVTHTLHRGVAVSELNADGIADVYRVRRLVEPAAVEAWAGASAERVAALAASVSALEAAREAHDPRAIVEHDLEFHRLLVGALDSGRLSDLHAKVLTELRLVASLADLKQEWSHVGEHRAIFDALVAGDTAACRGLLGRHLDTGESLLLSTARGERELGVEETF